jgi:Zn-finger protein
MADKCALCTAPIETIFLEKINGTYLKDKKGKKRVVCSACQKGNSLEQIRAKL